MLQRLLKTHGDESSETLLSTELAALCQQLSVQLSLLQQKERSIIQIQEEIVIIEMKAREEYNTCQVNIMRYSEENNNFLIRISQLEYQLISIYAQIESMEISFESIIYPTIIEWEMSIQMWKQSMIDDDEEEPEIVWESEDDEYSEIDLRLNMVLKSNQTLKRRHKEAMAKLVLMKRTLEEAQAKKNQFLKDNKMMAEGNASILQQLGSLKPGSATHTDLEISISSEQTAINRLKITNQSLVLLIAERRAPKKKVVITAETNIVNSASGIGIDRTITQSGLTRSNNSSRSIDSAPISGQRSINYAQRR